jgi:hypothetical protein
LNDKNLFDEKVEEIKKPVVVNDQMSKEKHSVGKPELIEIIKSRAKNQSTVKESIEVKEPQREPDNVNSVDPGFINNNDVVINNQIGRQKPLALMLSPHVEENEKNSQAEPEPVTNVIKVEPIKKIEPVKKYVPKVKKKKPEVRSDVTVKTITFDESVKIDQPVVVDEEKALDKEDVKEAVEIEPELPESNATTSSSKDLKAEEKVSTGPPVEETPAKIEVSEEKLEEILDLFSKKEYDD